MKRLLKPLLVGLIVAASTTAQGQEVSVVKLEITPAGRPEPALRYRLYPIPRELKAGNAAGLYYRAVLLLARRDQPGPDQKTSDRDRISELLEMNVDTLPRDEARKLLSKHEAVLHEVAIGARRQKAEWDIPLREDGVATLLMEVQETRSLARLLALKAKVESLDGKFVEALDTITTMIVLGRHVSESGTLVSSLVGAAIVGLAAEQIELQASLPDSPNLYWALTALPEPVIDMRVGFESEQFWLEGSIPYLDILDRTVLSKEQAAELELAVGTLLSDYYQDRPMVAKQFAIAPNGYLLNPALANYSTCKRQLIERGMPRERVEQMPVVQVVTLRWVQTYRALFDEELAFTSRPYAEASEAFAQLEKSREGVLGSPEGVLADLLLPSMNAAKGAFTRVSQRVAVLRIIEAIRLHAAAHDGQLPAKLSDIKAVPIPLDPVSGTPFKYELEGATAILLPQATHLAVRYELVVKK